MGKRQRTFCTIDGCDRPNYGHGLCQMHWARKRNTGTTDQPIQTVPFDQKWEMYFQPAGDGCWEWKGPIDAHTGYGRISSQWAHRVSYERNVGPIPKGLVIDHLCRNRACVRPDHLEVVTRAENNRRGEAPTWVAVRTNTCHRGHSLEDAYLAHRSDGTVTRRCRHCQLASENRRRRRAAAEKSE